MDSNISRGIQGQGKSEWNQSQNRTNEDDLLAVCKMSEEAGLGSEQLKERKGKAGLPATGMGKSLGKIELGRRELASNI